MAPEHEEQESVMGLVRKLASVLVLLAAASQEMVWRAQ